MSSRVYQIDNSDIYVLELKGTITNPKGFHELGEITQEIIKDLSIRMLIINQDPDHLKITSGGLEHIINLCAAIQDRSVVFSGVRNSFKKLLTVTKIYDGMRILYGPQHL